jgi:hypothetical protein
MDQLNDMLWTDEDEDIITIQGIMVIGCNMQSDCDGCEPPALNPNWDNSCRASFITNLCK